MDHASQMAVLKTSAGLAPGHNASTCSAQCMLQTSMPSQPACLQSWSEQASAPRRVADSLPGLPLPGSDSPDCGAGGHQGLGRPADAPHVGQALRQAERAGPAQDLQEARQGPGQPGRASIPAGAEHTGLADACDMAVLMSNRHSAWQPARASNQQPLLTSSPACRSAGEGGLWFRPSLEDLCMPSWPLCR